MRAGRELVDTGIAWLDRLPADWSVATLGRASWVRARLGWKGLKADEYVDEGGFPMLSTPDIKGRNIDFQSAARITNARFDESPEIMLQVDDVLLTKDGSTIGTANIVRDLPEPTTLNGSIALLTPSKNLNGRYLYFVTVSRYAQAIFGLLRGGAGVPHLFQRDINRIRIPLPPLEEQRAIADYLDQETAQIDALVAKQEEFIGLLRERRKAEITSAVTGRVRVTGAEHNEVCRPLVDSGNEYLGAVPPEWEISRFGRHMVVNGGQVDPRIEPWVDMVLIAPNHIESGTGRIIGWESARDQGADSGKYLARRGQILYSKIRPALNKVAIATEDCLCSADMYAMSSLDGRDDVEYLTYFMLSKPFHAFVAQMSMRVKMPKINREELSSAPWLRPPAAEQRRIARYLDEQTTRIDALISKAEEHIALAKERRTALITAAVTGQFDVRTARKAG